MMTMTLCLKMTPMHSHLSQSVSGQAAHQAVHHRQVELSAYRLALEAHHHQVELSACLVATDPSVRAQLGDEQARLRAHARPAPPPPGGWPGWRAVAARALAALTRTFL